MPIESPVHPIATAATSTVPPAVSCCKGAARSCSCEGQVGGHGATRTSAKSSSAVKCAEEAPSTERREKQEGPNRRLSVVDRRSGLDRRLQTRAESGYTGPERRSGIERRDSTGLERRRGPGRRRSDDRKSAEEGEMNAEQFEFIMAIETYKKVNRKIYPTWTEVLEVIRQLGYRKTLPRQINLPNVPEPPVVGKSEKISHG